MCVMIQSLLRDNIKKLKAYASAREEFTGEASIYLDANENPFNNGINRYPDPRQKDLKKVICQIKNIKEDNIVIGNGSDETIDLLIRSFCNPGRDNIIINTPTYGMYEVVANINDIECREITLNSQFQPDIKGILEKVTGNTKIIFLCSPNNPTGNCIDKDLIIELLDKYNGIVVVDEAYIDFAKGNSCVDILEKYPNLVILQTLSKAWGMAGLRIGFCIADKEITDILNKIKYPYNVNALSLKYAENKLKDIENAEYLKDILIKEREKLSKELLKLSFSLKVYPSDANFILWKVNNADKLYNYLASKGIITRKRSIPPLIENCIRVSVGTPEENYTLLEKLKDYEA